MPDGDTTDGPGWRNSRGSDNGYPGRQVLCSLRINPLTRSLMWLKISCQFFIFPTSFQSGLSSVFYRFQMVDALLSPHIPPSPSHLQFKKFVSLWSFLACSFPVLYQRWSSWAVHVSGTVKTYQRLDFGPGIFFPPVMGSVLFQLLFWQFPWKACVFNISRCCLFQDTIIPFSNTKCTNILSISVMDATSKKNKVY